MSKLIFTLNSNGIEKQLREICPKENNKHGFEFTSKTLYCFYDNSFQYSESKIKDNLSLEISFEEFKKLLNNNFKTIPNLIFY